MLLAQLLPGLEILLIEHRLLENGGRGWGAEGDDILPMDKK